MKKHALPVTLFSLLIVNILFINARYAEMASSESPNIEASSFAVVELFTSQGCSSCPPADRLLSEIVEKAALADQPVYALSFHVDYWNYLGWKDPFSDARYSERQRAYARVLKERSVYTPQMVVNGSASFVGSRRAQADEAIQQAMTTRAAAAISLQADWDTPGEVSVQYEVDSNQKNVVLNVTLIERNISTAVNRGENSGRKLTHDNVVRAFVTLELDSLTGNHTISLPADIKLEDTAIIAFVQDPSSMKVLGAADVKFQGKD